MKDIQKIFSLENKTALITGGGTGIGKEIAKCMVKAGANVLLTGRRECALSLTCDELSDKCRYIIHDVSDTSQAEGFAKIVTERVGVPDIIVNNAGINMKKYSAETEENDFEQIMKTNVLGAHAMTRAFIPKFIERGSGNILFITSMAAIFGIPEVSAYAASKSALLGLVRTYATELSPKGIRVNAIAPGWIETDMSKKAMRNDKERLEKILLRTPMNRIGKPEDIGWAAVYLCSDEAAFITGQQLVVDGGVSIGF
ncbi:MAG: SDR family oxidoreductase [Sedimentisphaerales bacterium]|nr:SDR family oxidoreductase [Sedimentisphaerales bacterium]